METKNREKLLLILTGLCGVLWLLNWLVISPLTASWHHRSDRIAELRKSIADGTMLIRRQGSIRGQWLRMSTNALSSSPTVAERQLFDAFDRWVRVSGVIEGSFNPQLKPTDDNYSVMECHADVTGNYDAVLHFLYNMESDPMGVQLEGANFTSRDDTGQQISLNIELSGLLLPVSADTNGASFTASADESNPIVTQPWSAFESIAQKNIFDPTRYGTASYARGPKPVVVHSFTFRGSEDGYVAFFTGEGTSEKGYFRVGDLIDGFTLRQVASDMESVKLTDPSGNIQTLQFDESLRRVDNGPWTKSEEPAPEATTTTSASPAPDAGSGGSTVSPAPSAPISGSVSDILAQLKKRKEEEK